MAKANPKRYQLTRAAANRSWSARTAKVGETDLFTEALAMALKQRYHHELLVTDTHTGLKACVGVTSYLSGPMQSQGQLVDLQLPMAWADALINALAEVG